MVAFRTFKTKSVYFIYYVKRQLKGNKKTSTSYKWLGLSTRHHVYKKTSLFHTVATSTVNFNYIQLSELNHWKQNSRLHEKFLNSFQKQIELFSFLLGKRDFKIEKQSFLYKDFSFS